MRERGGFLTLILAVGAIFYQSGSVAHPASSGPKNTLLAPSDVDHYQIGDQDLLKNFADLCQPETPLPSKSANSALSSQTHLNGCFEWIIATVPDPELSDMKLNFDREVETIQNAVESSGYHFDKYWFPWKTDEERLAAHQEEAGRDDRRNLPGLLLFRKPDDPSSSHEKPLAIFLVGETPTSGIVSAQFDNAIRFGRLSTPKSSDDVIKIAGPGFSGSLSSLASLTETNQKAIVRTWTRDFASQNKFRQTRPCAHLRSTTDSSILAINEFCHYVRDKWEEKGPIVLLVEEGTAFGGGITRASLIEPKDATPIGPIYILKFPRGLSKLRNATETKEGIPGFSAEQKSTSIAQRELPFSLKEGGTRSSELPYYSTEQSPVSQESVLFSIASLMKKGSLHYAGIVATDPLDLLFLSRFLRSACPNTRLFTLDPDLLFEHGSDGSDYQGILAVTNYPLFAFNQLWTGSSDKNTIRVFSSGESESIYNAVVALLSEGWDAPASNYKGLREFSDPLNTSDNVIPPLWITVATRSGYAPVAILREAAHSPFLTPMPQEPNRVLVPEYWGSWGYSFACIWCLCLIYSGAVLLARPSGNRLIAMFSVKPSEPNPFRRAHFLLALGLCLSILVAVWLAVPYIIFNAALPNSGWQLFPLLAAFSGMMLVICLRLLTRYKTHRRRAAPQWRGLALICAIQAGVFMLRPGAFAVELHTGLIKMLNYGGILILAAAMGMSATHVVTPVRRVNRGNVTRLWEASVIAVILIAVEQIVACCMARPNLGQRLSLIQLWTCLCAGSAFFGAASTSAALPLADAIQGLKRVHHPSLRKLTLLISAQIYFWFSVALAGATVALLFWALLDVQSPSASSDKFLAACRSINISSGVCPLAPLSLFILSLCVWCFVQLRRITYHEDRCPTVPNLPDDVFCPALGAVIEDVKKRIECSFFLPAYNALCFLTVLLAVCLFLMRKQQTLESSAMDAFITVLASAVGVSVLMTCARFALIWSAFREFLRQLERHPLREIFGFLPRGFLWVPIWQGGNKKRTHIAITRSLECVLALLKSEQTPPALKQMLFQARPQLIRLVKRLLQFSAARRRVRAPFYSLIQNHLAQIGTIVAMELELGKWPRGGYEARSELSSRDINKDAVRVTRGEFETEEPYTICSELLALRFVPFINYVLLQLQNLASYLSIGFILLLTAMNSYVFRARTLIDWYLAVLFVLLGAVVVTVFSQIDRDAILSRITRTEEGKLDRHFFFRLISYGAIPSVALLGSHVPAIGKFFFSWIKPALEAIH